MTPDVAVSQVALDRYAIRAHVAAPEAGAVVLFEGTARDHHEGRSVESLAYEAYVPMALQELAKIRAEAMARFGLSRCAIHHRVDLVPIGEAAVIVACSSPHRKEAFEAVAWIMDRIKESVPIWKRERYVGGAEAWVEGEERARTTD